MDDTYPSFFHRATDCDPYPYQVRMGTEAWPDILDVPTGLGKTAAISVAWLWKRLHMDADTPRRLVYCLPMRVLVEQTVSSMEGWLERIVPDFDARGLDVPTVHTMMGGEVDLAWRRAPERPAILVGTQDMMLSRALMRGYGMSRYQWSIDFALLHNDAMWAYDEVQLMGPALATSAQVDAFRRSIALARPSRSLWMSATLRPEWLRTVDFEPYSGALSSVGVSAEDREVAGERLNARKALKRSAVRLTKASATAVTEYVKKLVPEIIEEHRPGSQTLVIVNRVDRAQALFREVRAAAPEIPSLLLHSRFRAAERRSIEAALRDADHPPQGRIVIATQAVEAGVDMTSATLFTELAPWSSMVQRFGRCNRYGEVEGGAAVVWIDLQVEGKDAAPYEQGALEISRALLQADLLDVGPESLPPVPTDRPLTQVLRRRDFVELFNTDPDLSGFDIDISPYIRDPGAPQVQVYWRSYDQRPGTDLPAAGREELCNVSMGQMSAYLKKKGKPGTRSAWQWDPLLDGWSQKRAKDSIIPGVTFLLDAMNGGYDAELGFHPSATLPVGTLTPDEVESPPSYPADGHTSRFVPLKTHLLHVQEAAVRICAALDVAEAERRPIGTAAIWHDVGKAHPAFQTAMLDAADDRAVYSDRLWAKSPGSGRPRYRVEVEGGTVPRPYFRHELASMLAWLKHANGDADADLVAYLIAAHHGKVRMGLRALPAEPLPDDDRLVARGVWDGDELPPLMVGGREVPGTTLHLDLMRMGRGPMGPSWTERTQRLLDERGPFVLAWLESLLRLADWQASAAEEEAPDDS